MPTVEYLIMAGGALAAGFALGPIINQRTRHGMIAGGILAALAGAALVWPPSRGILSQTLATCCSASRLCFCPWRSPPP
jgi:hypothetical protein